MRNTDSGKDININTNTPSPPRTRAVLLMLFLLFEMYKIISQIFYLVSQNKLPFRLQHYNPKVFYWNEIWLLCRPFENDELRAGHGQQQHLGRLRHSYDAQLVLRSANIKEKTSLTSLYQQQLPELLMQGRMDKCFHVVYTKSWPYHPNVAAEIEKLSTRQHFPIICCLILVSSYQ